MYKIIFYIIFLLLVFFSTGFSQEYLSGKILKKGSTDVLAGVNIKNYNAQKFNTSDMGGNYRVTAKPGDTIIFSSAGYKPDTLFTSFSMLHREQDVYLVSNVVQLAAVEIDAMRKYEADSLRRREDYAALLNRKHPVRLMNEKIPYDKPGFNFSPIGFFSKNEKQKRRLLKRIKDEDENEYIDTRFPRSRVALVTKLTGDSLQHFMLLYRPGYAFCRKSGNQDILLYINDKLLLFRKGANEKMRSKF